MPSFDSVNYAIRPNKTVERKITFSGLTKVSRIIDLSGHRYVGLGSLWFVDFLMAHKILGISSMISIENDEIGYRRAEFNRPLSCITIINGDTTRVIPQIGLEASPSLVWLDYDSSIGGPVLPDIAMLVSKCAPGSILIVTISAKLDDLPTQDQNDLPIDLESSIRMLAGDLVPTPLPNRILKRKNYPKLLCEILSNQFLSCTIRSGREETFIKLFDIVYSDGTPMVTIGGVLAAPQDVPALLEMVQSPSWSGIVADPINIPPLTVKERSALDRTMPSPEALTPAQMDKLGFPLRRDQIEAYHRHYIHYPTFGELQL